MSSFRQNGQVPKAPKTGASIGRRIASIGIMLAAIVALYALAQKLDETDEALQRYTDARLHVQLEQMTTDREWIRRLGQAYAKGRLDALKVSRNSPESVALANACAALTLASIEAE